MTSDYHDIDAYHSSKIRAYAQDPIEYFNEYILGKKDYGKAAEFGTLVHTAILEPDRFDREIALKPAGMKFSTKEGKAWRDLQSSKLILDADDAESIQSILQSLRLYFSDDFPFNFEGNILDMLRNKTTKEQEVFQQEFEIAPGLIRAVKIKPDAYFIFEDTLIIIDVKTSNKYNFENHQFTINNSKYYIQAAWYSEILKKLLKFKKALFYNLFIESSGSFRVKCVDYDPEFLKGAYDWIPGYIEAIELMEEQVNLAEKITDFRLGMHRFDHQWVR